MELLYGVGGLIVLVLLWRAVSWLREYQRRLRIRLEPVPPGPDHVESFPELGKVRVRPRLDGEPADDGALPEPVIVLGGRVRDEPRVTAVSAAALRQPAAVEAEPPPIPTAPASIPSPVPVPERMTEPTLQAAAPVRAPAPVHVPAPMAHAPVPARAEPAPLAAAVAEASTHPLAPLTASAPASGDEQPPVLLTPVAEPLREAEQADMFADEPVAPPPMPGRTRTRAQALYDTPAVEPVRPVRPVEARPHVDVQDVIALHVVASRHPFNGEDLLRSILSYGLRFGDMNIFHRHERPTGQGKVLFSMAKAVEPGTFDLQTMTGEEIPGVSFFLSLPGVTSILAYDIMVDTAKRLATELQGEILDEQRQPLTRQLVEHYRERVQEFERRRLMQRPSH